MRQPSPIHWVQGAAAVAAGAGIAAVIILFFGGRKPDDGASLTTVVDRGGRAKLDVKQLSGIVRARPAPEFVEKGIAWLLKAQHPDGGWGAGSHANQEILDPHAVAVDPATTAFAASALLRSGSTPIDGKHATAVRRATEYLCGVVENYTKPGPRITDLEDTQIQAKLGPLVDTAMTAQYLARVLPKVPKSDALHERIDRALDKCVAKLNESQQPDGSWNAGDGWAPVLQSSLACSALEFAQAAGKSVDLQRLDAARKYIASNYDAETGATNTDAAAGVELYAFGSSMRANAAQGKAATDLLDEAKQQGKLAADAPVTEENLKKAGVQPGAASDLVAANTGVTAQNATINGRSTPAVAALAVELPKGGLSSFGGLGGGAAGGGFKDGDLAVSEPFGKLAERSAKFSPKDVDSGGTVAGAFGGDADGGLGDTAATTEEALLAGFGNNGGEEFFTYMLTAETAVILGDTDWNNWYDKMSGRLSKVQNPDGSWSGHHCITSPVFCTAAVVQTMTADHDAPLLVGLAKEAAVLAKSEMKFDALRNNSWRDKGGGMPVIGGGLGGGMGGGAGGGFGGGMGAAY